MKPAYLSVLLATVYGSGMLCLTYYITLIRPTQAGDLGFIITMSLFTGCYGAAVPFLKRDRSQ